MNKIKKLFKFLPVMFLSVLCCITSALCYDQEVDTTYADAYMITNTSENSIVSYYGADNTFAVSLDIDGEFILYQDPSNNMYFVNYVFHFNSISVGSYTFTQIYDDMNLFWNGEEDTEFLVRFGNFGALPSSNLAEFNISLSNISFNLLDMSSDFYGYWLGSLGLTYFDGLNRVNYNDIYFVINMYPLMPSSSWLEDNMNSSNLSLSLISYSYDYSSDEYQLGYNAGYERGYLVGYNEGNNYGFNYGYDVGFTEGARSRDADVTYNYNLGYQNGYDVAFSSNMTAVTIFNGILQVGMLPINVLLAIFNFEILGINLSAFVSAILTVCLTVIVIRTIKGGGND